MNQPQTLQLAQGCQYTHIENAPLQAVYRTVFVDVTVQLSNELGNPAASANITLDGNVTHASNVNGSTVFTGVPIGKHRLQVEHPNYLRLRAKETILENTTLNYTLSLKPMLHVDAALVDGTLMFGNS